MTGVSLGKPQLLPKLGEKLRAAGAHQGPSRGPILGTDKSPEKEDATRLGSPEQQAR